MEKFIANLCIIIISLGSSFLVLFEKDFSPSFSKNIRGYEYIVGEELFSVRSIPFYPFSSYPMFSDDIGSHGIMSHLDIRGVKSEGELFLPN